MTAVTTTLTDDDIQVGDLWTLADQSGPVRHVVIAKAHPTFAVVWPMADGGDLAVAPGVQVGVHAGDPVTLWPQLATGVSLDVLGRRIGWVLAPETVGRVRRATDVGTETCPLPAAPAALRPERSRRALASLMSWMQRLCF